MQTIRVNTEVKTPQGRGVVWGRDEQGRLLVHLPISGGSDPACLTPNGRKRSLWAFPPEQVEIVRGR